jgi:transcriptional regulator with XRE-family HTH domain
MKLDTKTKLIHLIREEIGEFKIEINSLTQIENDLGVTGDDAIELIQKIATLYDIDIENFNFKKYFHDEPSFLSKYREIVPITIGDILEAIKIGKLE